MRFRVARLEKDSMSIYQLADCRHGRFLYNQNDTYIGKSLDHYGEWSQFEVDLFAQFLRPGDHVVEAGSNIGSHTVAISRIVGDGGLVHSFEPMRYTQQLLSANLALNECFNVISYRAAVGRESKRILFPLVDPRTTLNFGALSVMNVGGDPTEEIDQQKLDLLNLQRLDFIKADIEGYEVELLLGASQSLAKFRPIIYLEFDSSKDKIIEYFTGLNYTCYYFISPMFHPQNFRGSNTDIFGASSTDFLCVPDEKVTVTGLTAASVADGRVSWPENGINYAVLPFSGARVEFIGSAAA